MIPDLAIIISAYAIVRLLNDYVLPRRSRLLAIVGVIAIAVGLIDVLSRGDAPF